MTGFAKFKSFIYSYNSIPDLCTCPLPSIVSLQWQLLCPITSGFFKPVLMFNFKRGFKRG